MHKVMASASTKQHLTKRESEYPMIPVGKAIKMILDEVEPTQICYARLNECGGRILSKDVHSPIDLPRCNTSIMDGYALNYGLNYNQETIGSDIGIFKVITAVTAGNEEKTDNEPQKQLDAGEVIYVTTGSALAMNADCVIKIEDTEIIDESTIKILHKPRAVMQSIRPTGSDIKKGQLILSKGTKLNSSELGILASVGVIMIPVYNKIRITVLSTGDELTDPFTYKSDQSDNDKTEYKTNLVFDSNKLMLMELINESLRNLCIVQNGGIIRDDKETLKKHILLLLQNTDILITSGGVSMGARDYIKPILKEIGDIKIGRVSIKPGKPTTFATVMIGNNQNTELTKKLFFGLPGNPVSTNVCFKMFVEPAIRKYAGIEKNFNCQHPPLTVEITQDIRMDPERPNFNRCVVYWDKAKGHFIGVQTGSQRSSRLLSCKSANCLLRIPQKSGVLPKGSMVKALVIGPLIPNMPPVIDEDVKEDDHEHLMDCDCGRDHGPKSGHSGHDHSGHSSQHGPAHNESKLKMGEKVNIGVLTVSDRASKGVYEDKSGPALVDGLKELFGENNINKMNSQIVPDESKEIEKYLHEWDNNNKCHLIITSGGTGFGPRDITPDVTKKFIKQECSGIVFKMMEYGLKQTKFASLSRYMAGITENKTLIINMPGSVKGVKECLEAIKDILPHAINQINEKPKL